MAQETITNVLKEFGDNLWTLIAVGHEIDDMAKFIEIFDKDEQTWIEVNCELFKHYFTAVLLKDKLMLIGVGSNIIQSNTVEYYNFKTGKIESLLSTNYTRGRSAATKYGEDVFIFGGFDGDFLRSVEKWDSSTNTWNKVAPMITARYGFAVAVFGNEIFAVGGAQTKKYLSVVEAYSPEKNTWRICRSLNEKRCYHGMVAVGNYLYVAGGRNETRLKSVERYDPKIDNWTTIQSMESIRSGLGLVNWNERLVAAGGRGDEYLNTVEVYDEQMDQWKLIPSMNMNKPRGAFKLITIPWSLAKLAIEKSQSEFIYYV